MTSQPSPSAAPSVEVYDLVILLFSDDERWLDRLTSDLPRALRLARVSDVGSLRAELADGAIPCGVLVDVDLPRDDRVALFDELGSRWARPATLPLAATPSDAACAEARCHTSNPPLYADEPVSAISSPYYRRVLSGTISWIASRLMFGREIELDAPRWTSSSPRRSACAADESWPPI